MYAQEGAKGKKTINGVVSVWAGNGNQLVPYCCSVTICQISPETVANSVFKINTDNFNRLRESVDGIKSKAELLVTKSSASSHQKWIQIDLF